MTAMSDWLENKILTDYLVSATGYVALYSSATTDAGGGSEVSGGTYVRRAGTFNVSNGVATLAGDLVWNGMPAVTVSHLAIWTALSGGNMLFHGPLVAAKVVAAGDAFAMPTGNLTVTLD